MLCKKSSGKFCCEKTQKHRMGFHTLSTKAPKSVGKLCPRNSRLDSRSFQAKDPGLVSLVFEIDNAKQKLCIPKHLKRKEWCISLDKTRFCEILLNILTGQPSSGNGKSPRLDLPFEQAQNSGNLADNSCCLFDIRADSPSSASDLNNDKAEQPSKKLRSNSGQATSASSEYGSDSGGTLFTKDDANFIFDMQQDGLNPLHTNYS
ncbi:uncharacterized protein VICG_00252, partial [Vittaforma corneae ATCC 50505]